MATLQDACYTQPLISKLAMTMTSTFQLMQFVSEISSKNCRKCLPLSRVQPHRRVRHSSAASLLTCSVQWSTDKQKARDSAIAEGPSLSDTLQWWLNT